MGGTADQALEKDGEKQSASTEGGEQVEGDGDAYIA